MSEYDKFSQPGVSAYIEQLQGLISRMATNSANCKAYAVAILAAVLALSDYDGTKRCIITAIPTFLLLTTAYLFLSLNKYSPRSKVRVRDNKLYTVDVAVMNNRVDAFAGENIGWRLETIIYLELRRRARYNNDDVYYYKRSSRSKEVDFVLCKDNKALQLYQVAYDITEPKTRKR